MSAPNKKPACHAVLPQTGRVAWIGLAARSRAPITSVDRAEAVVGKGLVGDHRGKTGKREVTLIQGEHLPVIAALMGLQAVSPETLRRNVVVTGINLAALIGREFRVGAVTLVGTKPCDPCERIEEALGPGGFNATEGMGGIIARVLSAGSLRVGDEVEALPVGELAPDA
jgi:MOSC domain-containing protein YiiM